MRAGKSMSKIPGSLLCLGLWLSAYASGAAAQAGPQNVASNHPVSQAELDARADEHWAVLEEYCMRCHDVMSFSGGLAFDIYDPRSIAEEAEVWERAVRQLRGRLMPPAGEDRPDNHEVDELVAWLEGNLDQAEVDADPGVKPPHRLNRTEYANAVRDLLRLDIDSSQLLPLDGVEHGFDNIASALQVTPTFIDAYLEAARLVSEQAVGTPSARPSGTSYSFPTTGQSFRVEGLPLGSRGGAVVEHYFPSDGEYVLNIGNMATGLAAAGLEHKHTLVATIGGRKFFETEIGGLDQTESLDKDLAPAIDEFAARLREIPFTTTAGPHEVAVFFLRRSFAESDSPLQQMTPRRGQDAVAMLREFEIYGPVNATGLSATPSRERIFSCHPDTMEVETDTCARQIVTDVAHEAFKGMLTEEDAELLMGMYEVGYATGGFERGVEFALSGILAHPRFLFRLEPASESLAPGESRELSSLELASRLSFFLWSSIPDAELLHVALQGELTEDPAVLEAQVLRMLGDRGAANLAENFGFQWLGLGELDEIVPDRQLFADVDRNIRRDLTQETVLFLESIFREDRSVLDLLRADHTYLNENLALHYGLNQIRGDRFRRVQLQDERRWGLLGKGAVLMASSYPNRTSPVLRGDWILHNIMGTPPAAPPPDVEGFEEIQRGEEFTTVRERLERHREDPSCNGCHGVIDPLGFALENFDAVGRWREMDRMARTPIDSSGVLADGTPVDGPVALREAILNRPELFVQTVTERLMTFALGRGVEYHDMPTVRRIVREAAAEDYRLSALVRGIVNSPQFRMKREAPEAPRSARVFPDLQPVTQAKQ